MSNFLMKRGSYEGPVDCGCPADDTGSRSLHVHLLNEAVELDVG